MTTKKSPAEIAREAFRQLAVRRIVPTPEAYRDIYYEIAGMPPPTPEPVESEAEKMLSGFAATLSGAPGDYADFGRRCSRAAKSRDWEAYGKILTQFIERSLKKPAGGIELAPPPPPPASANIPLSLVDEKQDARQLREMLGRALNFALPCLLQATPELAAESENLGRALKDAHSDEALNGIAARLKQLCYQIEVRSGDAGEQQEMLYRLFKLLLENISEMLEDDSWLRGQIEVVQDLLSGPLDQRALEDATRAFKDVIYKQGQLKNSIADARGTVKNLMQTFLDRLAGMVASTGDFHDKMGGLNQRISHAQNIADLSSLMDEVLAETRHMQEEARNSRDRMASAQNEVTEAERKIAELEQKLQQLSELVREDQLTGSLNRRGLEDVYERETARSERRGTPLCVAMLDLDNFKKLNDSLGHQAGDGALKHLVRIVKSTLRSMDVIARYGGEEFLILFPETTVEAATTSMMRVQRELTKHFFMHENEKVLITFSAGVALRQPGESQESLLKRADEAMYQAKRTGKNRVVVAE
ncbi:diguanylate cyclase [Massilia sp. W12]|uniref:sensor domain-containing diguanylate cyclase n=1 Tax=Massilia sp. W12 TaxID=3126507 RepID=UPI0030CB6E15